MKFLSELGSWCGGATVRPTEETTTTPSTLTSRKKEEVVVGRLSHGGNSSQAVPVDPRGLRKVKSTSSHWKPTLHMISEDKVGSDDDKLSAKIKAKSGGKAKSTYHGGDYWKSTNLWAIPAFAPSPF